jgi:CRISPR-associated endoribonuclease Cas6
VNGTDLVEPPEFGSGRVSFRTTTPVVMKGSGKGDDGTRTTRQAWLLPQDTEFPAYFAQNLRRKAATLGLGDEIHLEAISSVGPKRSFAVKGGKKVGATVQVDLSGEPAILRALWSWGLGQGNAAGFGWVAA